MRNKCNSLKNVINNNKEYTKISLKNLKKVKTKESRGKNKEDKMLYKAHKNIICVINNLIDDIQEEQINGKSNLQYKNENVKSNLQYKNEFSQRQRTFQINNIKPIEKLINITPQKERSSYKIDSPKNRISNKNVSKSTLFSSKALNKYKYKNSRKDLFKNSQKKFQIDSSIYSSHFERNYSRKKGYQSSIKGSSKKLYIKSFFFKPKNKLKSKWKSSKNCFLDISTNTIKNINSDNINNTNNLNNNILDENKYSSALNSNSMKYSSDLGLITNSRKKNLNFKEQYMYKSDIGKSKLINNKNQNSVNLSPFLNLEQNIKIDSEILHQKLYEYENNEITHRINQLPEKNKIIKKEKVHRKSNALIDKNLKIFKSLRDNYKKNLNQFYKENKYRILIIKGHVYDSLDDEEEMDEEEIDIYYIEPDNMFLYIIDSITFISSLIILLYFPICLAKTKFFCNEIRDMNAILFYSIDMIYIIDLVINFYRSYYNYDEILIKNKIHIFIHYLKTWFLLDFICCIPIFTLIKVNQPKCIGTNIYKDFNLNNNGKHSIYYNTNINNLHYLLMFIKIIKIFKSFRQNLAASKIKEIIFKIDFFFDWGNVFIYIFLFFAFLNLGACIFIFIGRNTFNNWIIISGLEMNSFIDIYLAAIQNIIQTVTTVGYGELVGKNIKEIFFQIIMLIAGTCIYSWLISNISNYVKKMNEVNIKYEEKLNILEEIKVYNPNFTETLYDNILRFLRYRRYHEEEIEKDIVLNSLPNSLKNTLLMEMYKVYIDGFLFFKGIENREFIIQVISKLEPITGKKGDILIKEGENIENIIFIKNGVLSLEVWIDMSSPEDSIQNYLNKNDFLKNYNDNNFYKKKNRKSKKSLSSYFKASNLENSINKNKNKHSGLFDFGNLINFHNKKKLKILNIRKNVHFGDVYMFLNKKSPLYVRVKTKKADLLLLKKLDALNISHNYPDIWKSILKNPLVNSKMIKNITIEKLTELCNFYGIKTKLFKNKRNNQKYPPYYLNPVINNRFFFSRHSGKISKALTVKNKKFRNRNITILEEEDEQDSNISEKGKRKSLTVLYGNDSNNNFEKNNVFSIKSFKKFSIKDTEINNNKNIYNQNNDMEGSLITFKKHISKKFKDSLYNSPQNFKLSILKNKNMIYNNKVVKSEGEEESDSSNSQKNNNDLNTPTNKSNNEFILDKINDEIYPGENFNIKLYNDEKISKDININSINKNSTKNGLNNLNLIDENNIYSIIEEKKGLELKIKKLESELKSKKSFNILDISSSESTMEINSSYENIDQITNHKYIFDNKLRYKTKEFLIINSNYSYHQLSSMEETNAKNKNSEMQNKVFYEKEKSMFISKKSSNKIEEENFSNKLKNKFRKSIIYHNQKNQAENFVKNLKNLDSTNIKTTKSYRGSLIPNTSNTKNMLLGENGNNSFDQENNKLKDKRHSTKERKFLDIYKNKKKKIENELDIISNNILKSSQNLNEPDVFYAGLFNQLIFKGNSNKSNRNLSESKIK